MRERRIKKQIKREIIIRSEKAGAIVDIVECSEYKSPEEIRAETEAALNRVEGQEFVPV